MAKALQHRNVDAHPLQKAVFHPAKRWLPRLFRGGRQFPGFAVGGLLLGPFLPAALRLPHRQRHALLAVALRDGIRVHGQGVAVLAPAKGQVGGHHPRLGLAIKQQLPLGLGEQLQRLALRAQRLGPIALHPHQPPTTGRQGDIRRNFFFLRGHGIPRHPQITQGHHGHGTVGHIRGQPGGKLPLRHGGLGLVVHGTDRHRFTTPAGQAPVNFFQGAGLFGAERPGAALFSIHQIRAGLAIAGNAQPAAIHGRGKARLPQTRQVHAIGAHDVAVWGVAHTRFAVFAKDDFFELLVLLLL